MEDSSATVAEAQATGPVPTFIGRDTELAALGDALPRAGAGERQPVLLSDEPGIGKTGTLTQFARHPRD